MRKFAKTSLKIIKKALLITGISLFVLLALGTLAYYFYLDAKIEQYLTQRVQSELEKQFKREVSIERIQLNFPNPQVIISNVAIAREQKLSEGTLLSAKEARARLLLRTLLSDNIVLDDIVLNSPSVWVEFDEQGASNLPSFETEEKKEEEPQKEPSWVNKYIERLYASDIQIINGQIYFAHKQLSLTVSVKRLNTKASFSLKDLHVQGNISLEDGEIEYQKRGAIPIAFGGDVEFRKNTLTISSFQAQAGSSEITLDGTLDNLSQPTLDLSVLTKLALDELDGYAGINQNLTGMVDFKGTVTGQIPDIAARGHLDCPKGTAWKLAFENVSTDIQYQEKKIMLTNLGLDLFDGHAAGNGELSFAGPPQYAATLTAANLNIEHVNTLIDQQLDIAGKISGDVNVRADSFDFEDLFLQTDLDLQNGYAYGVDLPRLKAQVGIQNRTLSIKDLEAEVFEGKANGNGSLVLHSNFLYQADLDVEKIELDSIMQLIPEPPDVSGQVSGKILARGSDFDLQHLILDADLNLLNVDAYDIKAKTLQALARIQDNTLSIENLSAQLFEGNVQGKAQLVLAGEALPKFTTELTLEEISVPALMQQFAKQEADQKIDIDGELGGDITAAGNSFALEDIRAGVALKGTGNIIVAAPEDEEQGTSDKRLPFDLTLASELKNNIVTISKLTLNSPILQMDTAGTINLSGPEFSLDYEVASKDLSTLMKQILVFIPGQGADSPLRKFAGNIEYVKGTIEGPVSQLAIHAEALLSHTDFVWVQADEVRADVTYQGNAVTINQFRVSYQDAGIEASGTVDLTKPATPLLDLPVTIKAGDLTEYLAMFKQELPVTGRLDRIQTTIRGPVNNVAAQVKLTLTDGTAWEQHFEKITGDVDLADNRLTIHSLTVKENEGNIALTGLFGFDLSYQATLSITGLNFQDIKHLTTAVPQLQGQVDSALRLEGTVSDPTVSGTLLLSNLKYNEIPVDDVTCEVSVANHAINVFLTAFRSPAPDEKEFGVFIDGTLDFQGNYALQLDSLLDLETVQAFLPKTAGITSLTGRLRLTSEAQGTLSSALEGLHVQAELALEEGAITYRDFETIPTRLLGELELKEKTLTLSDLRLKAGSSELTVDGTLHNITSPELNLSVTGDVKLAEIDRYVHIQQNLSGNVKITGTVTGPVSDIMARAHIQCAAGTAWKVAFENIETDVKYEKNTVSLSNLELDFWEGHIAGKVELSLVDTPGYTASMTFSDLQLAHVETLTPTPLPLAGKMNATLNVQSEGFGVEGLIANTSVNLKDVEAYGISVPTLRIVTRLHNQMISVKEFSAQLFDGTLEGQAELAPFGETVPKLETTLILKDISIQSIVRQFAAQLEDQGIALAGQVGGNISLTSDSFAFDDFRSTVVLQGKGTVTSTSSVEDISATPLPFDLTLRSSLEDRVVTLSSLAVETPVLQINTSGTVDIAETPGLNINYEVAPQDLHTLLRQVADFIPGQGADSPLRQFTGNLEYVQGKIEGPVSQLAIRSKTSLSNTDLVWVQADEILADVTYQGNTVMIKQFQVYYQNVGVEAAGIVDLGEPAAPQLDIPVTIKAGTLTEYLAMFKQELPVTGTLDQIQTTISGPVNNIAAHVALTITDGTAWEQSFDEIAGDVALADNRLTIHSLTVKENEGNIAVKGFFGFDQSFQAGLTVTDLDFHDIKHLHTAVPQLQGQVNSTLNVEGIVSNPTVTGSIMLTNLRYDDIPVDDVTCEVSMANQTVGIFLKAFHPPDSEEDVGIFAKGNLDFQGNYALELNSLLDLQTVQAFLPEAAGITSLVGQLRLTSTAQGSLSSALEGLQARANLALEDGTITYRDFETITTVLLGEMELKEKTLTLSDLRLKAGSSELTVDGTLHNITSPELNLSVTGDVKLAEIDRYVHIQQNLSGNVNITGTVTGPVSDIMARAHIQCAAGTAWKVGFENVKTDVKYEKNTVSLSNLALDFWEGRITGQAKLALTEIPNYTAALTFTGLRLTHAENLLPNPVPLSGFLNAAVDVQGDGFGVEGLTGQTSLTLKNVLAYGINVPRADVQVGIKENTLSLDKLDIDAFQGHLTGTGSLALFDLGYQTTLNIEDIELASIMTILPEPPRVSGQVSTTITAQGTGFGIEQVTLETDLTAKNLEAYEIKIPTLHISTLLEEQALSVKTLSAQLFEGTLEGAAMINLDDTTLPKFTTQLTLQDLSVQALAQQFAAQLEEEQGIVMAGVLGGDITVAGNSFTLEDIRSTVALKGAGTVTPASALQETAATPLPFDLTLHSSLRDRVVTLSSLAVETPVLQVNTSGTVDIAETPALNITYEAAPQDLHALLNRAIDFIPGQEADSPLQQLRQSTGQLGYVQGKIEGPISQLAIQAKTSLSNTDLVWVKADEIIADVTYQGNAVTIKQFQVYYQDVGVEAAGIVDLGEPAAPQLDIPVTIKAGTLIEYLAMFKQELPVTGRLDRIQTTISGPVNNVTAPVELTITDGTAWEQHFEKIAADVTLADNRLTIHSLTVKENEGNIALTGFFGFDLSYQMTLSITDLNFRDLAHLNAAAPQLQGQVDSTLRLEGTVSDPTVAGEIVLTHLRYNEILVDDVTCEVSVANQAIQVFLTAFRPPAPDEKEVGVFIDGTLDFQGNYALRLDSLLELQTVQAFLPETAGITSLTGRLRMTGTAQGSLSSALEGLQARANLALEDGTITYRDFETIPTVLLGEMELKENNLSLSALRLKAGNSEFTVTGALHNLTAPELNLSVTGDVRLAEIDRYVHIQQNLSGNVNITGTVTGPVSDIMARAHIQCAAGTAWKVGFENVETDVKYEKNTVSLSNLALDFWEGRITGQAKLALTEIPNYTAALTFTGLRLNHAENLLPNSVPLSGFLNATVDVQGDGFGVEGLAGQTSLTLKNVLAYGINVPRADVQVGIKENTLSLDKLDIDAFQGHLTGTGSLALFDLGYQTTLNIEDLELASIMTILPEPPPVSGQVSATITAQGNGFGIEQVTLETDLTAKNLEAYEIKIPTLHISTFLKEQVLSVKTLSAQLFEGTLEGAAMINLDDTTLPKFTTQLTLQEFSVQALAQQFAAQLEEQGIVMAGALGGDITVAGNSFALEDIRSTVALKGAGTVTPASALQETAATSLPFDLTLHSSLEDRVVTLSSLAVETPVLQVNTSGTVDIADIPALNITYEAAPQDLHALLNRAIDFIPGQEADSPLQQLRQSTGQLEYVQGTIQGPVSQLAIQAKTSLSNTDLVWVKADEIIADVTYQGNAVTIKQFQVYYQDVGVEAAGIVDLGEPAAPQLDIPVTIKAGTLIEYLAMFKQELPVTGRLDRIQTTISGPVNNVTAPVELTITDGTAWEQHFEKIAADVTLADNRLTIHSLTVKENEGNIALKGFFGFDLSFQAGLTVTDLDFHDINALKSVAVQYEGHLNATVDLKGTVNDPQGRANLVFSGLSYTGRPIEDVTCDVSLVNQTVQAVLKTFRQKLVASFELALPPELSYRAELSLEHAAVEQLLSLAVDLEGINGVIAGKIISEGNLNDIQNLSADVTLSELDLDIFGRKLKNEQDINIVVTPQQLTVHSLELKGDELALSVKGDMDFQNNLDLELEGFLDLGIIQEFLPEEAGISSLAGQFRISCNAQGTLIPSSLEGLFVQADIALEDGAIKYQDFETIPTTLSGNLELKENILALSDIRLKAGNSEITVNGTLNNPMAPDLNFDVAANLILDELDRYANIQQNLSGTVEISGSVTGPVSDMIASANVRCPTGTAWEVAFENVNADVVYQKNTVTLSNLGLDFWDGRIAGQAELSLSETPGYKAAVTFTDLRLDHAATLLPDPVPLTGILNATIDAQGESFDINDLIAKTSLKLRDIAAYGVNVPQAEIQGEIKNFALSVNKLDIELFRGKLTGNGNLGLSDLSYQAALKIQTVELAPVMDVLPEPPPVSGQVNAAITARGKGTDLGLAIVEADLTAKDLNAYEINIPVLRIATLLENQLLSVKTFSAQLFDGVVEGQATLAPFGETPEFDTILSLKNISSQALMQQFAAQLQDQGIDITGEFSGDITAHGDSFALEDIRGEAMLSGKGNLAIALSQMSGQQNKPATFPFELSLNSSLQNMVVTLPKLSAATSSLQLTTSGAIDLNNLTLNLDYEATSDNIQPLMTKIADMLPDQGGDSPLRQFTGNIDYVRGKIQGPVDQPEIHAEARLSNADFVWMKAEKIVTEAAYQGTLLTIKQFQAVHQNAAIEANGTVDLTEPAIPRLDIPVTIKAADVADYLAMFKQELPVTGTLRTIKTTLRGTPDDLAAKAALTMTDLTGWDQSLDEISGQFVLADNRFTIEAFTVRKNKGIVALKGFFGFDLSFQTAMTITDLNFRDFDVFDSLAVEYDGSINASLEVGGTLDNPKGKANIVFSNLSYNKRPIEDVTCDVSLAEQTVRAVLVTFRKKFIAALDLSLTPELQYRAELDMKQAAIEQILSLGVDIEGISGIITGKISSEGSLQDIEKLSADVKLSELDLDIFGQKIKNEQEIDLEITQQKLTVKSLEMRGKELGLFAKGFLDFRGNFDLDLDGILDLRPVKAFLPKTIGIIALAGQVQLICNVQGTFQEPVIQGIAEINQGTIQTTAYPDPVSDINGKLAFSKGKIQIDRIKGKVSKGTFTTYGTFYYTGITPRDFSFDVEGKNIVIRDIVDSFSPLLVTVSPHIRISGDLKQQKLAGVIVIHEALYSKEFDPLETIMGMISSKNRNIALATPEAEAEYGKLVLDLHIKDSNVKIKNKLADLNLKTNLGIQGTTTKPQVTGRIEVRQGKIVFGDIKYDILSGVLDFLDPLSINPEMNIQVETVVQQYDINLGIEGNLDQFSLNMTSEPPLSKGEITRLLAVGSDQGSLVINPVRSLFEEQIGRAVNLDVFTVDVDPLLSKSEGSEATPTVKLGKRLFKDLLLTFTTTVGGTEKAQIVEIEYELSDNMSLVASRNEKGEVDASFTFKFKIK